MNENDYQEKLNEKEKQKEQAVGEVYRHKDNLERRYQWGIILLVTLLSFLIGRFAQTDRVTSTITETKVKVESLEKNYDKIINQLDIIQQTLAGKNERF